MLSSGALCLLAFGGSLASACGALAERAPAKDSPLARVAEPIDPGDTCVRHVDPMLDLWIPTT